jgi:uncharacterized protein (TIGR04255 family)
MTDINYPKPPITEAVIGFEFKDSKSIDDLSSITSKFQDCYPNFEHIQSIDLDIQPSGHSNLVNNTNIHVIPNGGIRLSSLDMNKILLAWPNTLSISQLAPYPGWEAYFERFKHDWKIWKRTLGFREIKRVGLRYINRFDIPFIDGKIRHEDYINIYPKLPGDWPLHQYALQLTLPLQNNIRAQINSAIIESPLLNHLSIVFDLDLMNDSAPPLNDDGIFQLLEFMRHQKNEIFESVITDTSRRLFNGGI